MYYMMENLSFHSIPKLESKWTLCDIGVDKVLYKLVVSAIGETTERAKVELGLEKLNQGSPAGCRLVVSDLFTGP